LIASRLHQLAACSGDDKPSIACTIQKQVNVYPGMKEGIVL